MGRREAKPEIGGRDVPADQVRIDDFDKAMQEEAGEYAR